MRAVLTIAAAILLPVGMLGCAAAGVQVSEQQAQSFQPGHATYADVVAQLGAPTTSTVSSDGTRTAIYTYAAVSSRPQNFIPYIGPFVAGYDTSSSAVTFVFNRNNVLSSTTSSQSNMGAGANLASGGAAPQSTAQPR